MWIALVALYGILKGARDVIKKKAMEKNSAMEVLFFYTLLSFLFVTPEIKNALSLDMHYIGYIVIKSAVVFTAWICSFRALKKLPVSFFGIMDMSRVIFASVLGISILGETLTGSKVFGLILVLVGLLFVNMKKNDGSEEKIQIKFILLTLASCFFNAVSEMLDKMLMQHMNSGQLQFWYMFFMVVLYFLYMIASKTKIDIRILKNNIWIPVLSVLFVIGDKALFVACQQGDSTVIAITLIKQCSVLVTILGGRLMFKEQHTVYRTICALVIIAGIIMGVN